MTSQMLQRFAWSALYGAVKGRASFIVPIDVNQGTVTEPEFEVIDGGDWQGARPPEAGCRGAPSSSQGTKYSSFTVATRSGIFLTTARREVPNATAHSPPPVAGQSGPG